MRRGLRRDCSDRHVIEVVSIHAFPIRPEILPAIFPRPGVTLQLQSRNCIAKESVNNRLWGGRADSRARKKAMYSAVLLA